MVRGGLVVCRRRRMIRSRGVVRGGCVIRSRGVVRSNRVVRSMGMRMSAVIGKGRNGNGGKDKQTLKNYTLCMKRCRNTF